MTRTFSLLILAGGLLVAPIMPVWATSYAVAPGHEITAISAARIAFVATEKQLWMPETLDGFLVKPPAYNDGTKMPYAGLRKEEDRANLNTYLATFAALED